VLEEQVAERRVTARMARPQGRLHPWSVPTAGDQVTAKARFANRADGSPIVVRIRSCSETSPWLSHPPASLVQCQSLIYPPRSS
jgi:hypothetical protein